MIDLHKYLSGIAGVATALEAMCNGLEYQDSREDFTIDMCTYGDALYPQCLGCAATCALQDIAGIDFTTTTISLTRTRQEAGRFTDWEDVSEFECAINMARHGRLNALYGFCGSEEKTKRQPWTLTTHNWKKELPKVRRFIKNLMKDNDLTWEQP